MPALAAFVGSMRAELKAAFRAIAAQPGFSALIVAVLGVGLACTIFMLVMMNTFVLRPLPFPSPGELLSAAFVTPHSGDDAEDIASRDLISLRRALDGKAEVGGFTRSTVTLSDMDKAERFDGAFVTGNFWRVLGVAPMLGRDFTADDERPGAAAVAVLAFDVWQQRYGGDPAIVGRVVRVNSAPATVIGVMPPRFTYPYKETIWLPAQLTETPASPTDDGYVVVMRRHAGVSGMALRAAAENWFADAVRAEPDRLRGYDIASSRSSTSRSAIRPERSSQSCSQLSRWCCSSPARTRRTSC
jgi:hypothetical protein